MSIKAIIFDMDGVLIDAKEWHYHSLNQALATFGFTIEPEEHLTTYDGLPTWVKLEKLSAEKNLPKELHSQINALKQEYLMEIVHTHCTPCLEHEEALRRLKQEGYRLAVASNSIRRTVDTMMQKANLQPYLEFTLSNQDVERPKPAPDIYLLAMEKLGLQPKECLIVEDNENGIRAATHSGGHVLVVKSVNDVNYHNIQTRIEEIKQSLPDGQTIPL